VACAPDFDLQNSLNMGIIFFKKRASTAQIGINYMAFSLIILPEPPALENPG
jgi:hypothetical protein